jgi:PAS domain S-box-containing protein
VSHLTVGLAYLAVYVVVGWALRGHPLGLSILGNAGMVSAAALVLGVIARRRRHWFGSHKVFWDTFAIGIAVWALGHFGWAYTEIVQRRPSWLEWHTIFSLCGGLGPLVALIARPHLGPRPHAATAIGVDIASYGLLAAFVYTYFVLVPSVTVQGGKPEAALLTVVQGYRFMLMLGMIVAAAVARRTAWGPVYLKLAIGVTAGFVLRILTNRAIDAGTYHIGMLYDFAWITPFLAYAWAAQTAPASEPEDEAVVERTSTLRFVMISATPVLLIPLIGYGALRAQPLGGSVDSFRVLLTGLATVVGLGLLTLRLVVQRGELQRSDARVRLLAAATEQTGDLILISRVDGSVDHANEAFVRSLGYTRPELASVRFPGPVAEGSDRLRQDIDRTVRLSGVWRGILQRRKRDGSTFPSACTVVALKDRAGTITHYVAVERDITEELRLRDQLVHSERLSAVGELVASVAHEINNPLQTIVGCVELMLDERTEGVVEGRDLELIRREAGRAGHIVRNLLSFVRRSANDRVTADLNEIVTQTGEFRAYHLRQQNIQLNLRCSREPLPVLVNPEEIQQVVLNLLLNAEQALESSNDCGTITVRTMRNGDSHIVEVHDDGPGVSPEMRGRIFEPFFTTKEISEGTGLGLSISHGIIGSHGGVLELRDSTVGACFRFTLPAHVAVLSPQPDAPSVDPAPPARALVVDDEEPIRKLLARLLERRGFIVGEAETGEAAMVRAQELQPRVVLCDVRMPGMSGFELYQRLNSATRDSARRFIFITGDTSSVDHLRDKLADVAVLAKPFTAADLDAALQRLDVASATTNFAHGR